MRYFVYLLACGDGSLYCGYTTNLSARVRVHNAGKGGKYTRSRLPVRLVFSQSFALRRDALRREYAIKQLSRAEKLALVRQKRGAKN